MRFGRLVVVLVGEEGVKEERGEREENIRKKSLRCPRLISKDLV